MVGMWSAMPAKLSIKTGSNGEKCAAAYEYDESNPEDTKLPEYGPGLKSKYHYMSFGRHCLWRLRQKVRIGVSAVRSRLQGNPCAKA